MTNSLSISGRVVDFARQDPNALRGITSGFGANSPLPGASSVASDLLWKPRPEFKAFAEASYSAFQGSKQNGPEPGAIAGLWWESSRWKWHTNYLRQPAPYLPVAGYIVDARSGYFADVSFAVHPRLDIYGATSLRYLDSADAWNSRVLVNLNQDTVALLAASGQLTPILANQQQWSAFLRVSRQLSWG